MLKKLFQVLVLGGATVATTSGCMSSADAQSASKKGTMKDAGSAAAAADAGMRQSAAGGGPKSW
jgi:hypothetical protein